MENEVVMNEAVEEKTKIDQLRDELDELDNEKAKTQKSAAFRGIIALYLLYTGVNLIKDLLTTEGSQKGLIIFGVGFIIFSVVLIGYELKQIKDIKNKITEKEALLEELTKKVMPEKPLAGPADAADTDSKVKTSTLASKAALVKRMENAGEDSSAE